MTGYSEISTFWNIMYMYIYICIIILILMKIDDTSNNLIVMTMITVIIQLYICIYIYNWILVNYLMGFIDNIDGINLILKYLVLWILTIL